MSVGLRILSFLLFVVAAVVIVVGALASAGPDTKTIAFGLVVQAAGLAAWVLATLIPAVAPAP